MSSEFKKQQMYTFSRRGGSGLTVNFFVVFKLESLSGFISGFFF